MKSIVPLAALSTVLSIMSPAGASNPHQGFSLLPEQLQWKPETTKVQMQIVHVDDDCRIVTKRVRLPPNTELPPHGHEQGYRLVTVISGTLQLGFGTRFDEKALQTLPPGSVFSEPAGHKHFARTGADAVILQLTEVDGKKPELETCR